VAVTAKARMGHGPRRGAGGHGCQVQHVAWGPRSRAVMKATALLRAVGHVPISETSPSRPAHIHTWRPDAVHDHQQITWHGWVGGCGRAIPGHWTARERPALLV
jgi:hypothetical protein